jgi:hypothetical protein
VLSILYSPLSKSQQLPMRERDRGDVEQKRIYSVPYLCCFHPCCSRITSFNSLTRQRRYAIHVSYFLPPRQIFSHLLLGVLIITVLLLEALGAGSAHAADGRAHFDIAPSFFPSLKNRIPRANYVYDSYPGALIRDSIHVKNSGTARGTVNLYSVDAITSPESGEAFPFRTDPRRDVGAWMTLNSQQITLNPGQSQEVPFSLSIPGHVRPGQHVGGIVAEEPDQQQSSSQGSFQTLVQLHTREVIGVLINLPGTTVEELKATGITYDETSSYQRVLVGLANTGTQFLHPSGSFQVTNAAGQQLQNVPMILQAILPQTSIDYPVYMHHQALAPGTYTAILRLGYEDRHQLNYTTSFVVPRPQLQKNSSVPSVISDLVTPNADFFSALTPWHYVTAICVLFCVLSTLFFWSQRLYKSRVNWRQKFNSRKPKG